MKGARRSNVRSNWLWQAVTCRSKITVTAVADVPAVITVSAVSDVTVVSDVIVLTVPDLTDSGWPKSIRTTVTDSILCENIINYFIVQFILVEDNKSHLVFALFSLI